MSRIIKRYIHIIALSILIVIILAANLKTNKINTTQNINTKSNKFYIEEKSILEKKMQNEKIASVYDYIKSNYRSEQPNMVHNLLHWFGGKLYEKEGMKGIAICDDAYKWGCFHGFFGKAFSEKGIKLLSDAQKECLRQKTDSVVNNGCIHGIGHGIMVMEGYNLIGLKAALKGCELLEENIQVMICASGVFMEYNEGLLNPQKDPGQLTSLRVFQNDDPYTPCNEVDSKFQPICFGKWTSWLWQETNGDFMKINSLCGKIQSKINRNSCFRGLGEIAVGLKETEAGTMINFCKNITDSDGIKSCLKAVVYEMNLQKDPKIIQLCQELGKKNTASCITDSYEYN